MEIKRSAVKYLVGLTMVLGVGTFGLMPADSFLMTELPAYILGGFAIIVGFMTLHSLWNWELKKGHVLCGIGIGLGLLPFFHGVRGELQETWTGDLEINQEVMESLEELDGFTISELIEKQAELVGEEVRVKGIVNRTRLNTEDEGESYLWLNPTNLEEEDDSLNAFRIFTTNRVIRRTRSDYRAVSIEGVLREVGGRLVIEDGRVVSYSTVGSRRWLSRN